MARTVKCPGCGADLTVKDGNRDFMFCEYCGTKVRLDDYQETHRYVNEAEVKKVEAEKEIKLKQMEIDEKGEKKALIVLGIMGGIGILFMLIGRFL
mgnify:CR=1 FL=1